MQFLRRLAATLKSGFRVFMPTCRDVSRLQSDALDQPLSPPRRIGLRLHLLACKWCRRYGRQIRFLRRAANERSEQLAEAAPRTLSPEARERLKRTLSNESK